MAYRNGTYIAFHANGTNIPVDSDIKYYNLIKAWTAKKDDDFAIINSHEKNSAVRDSSKKETLKARLKDRLKKSKKMVLIGPTTKLDKDWVPFEIEYAVDDCDIPIIIAYTGYESVRSPKQLSNLWPKALKERIDNGTLSAIHIPFKKNPLKDAITQFSHSKKPSGGSLGIYDDEAYKIFGIELK
jgi:hypothetical protein